MRYEVAYCHYRLNDTAVAEEILKDINEAKDPRKTELLGQILYRKKEYADCCDVYRKICKSTADDYDDERLSNLSAVVASMRVNNIVSQKGLTFENFV